MTEQAFLSSRHWQREDVVEMRYSSSCHRIFKLEFEAVGRTDAAQCRKRSAKHDCPVIERAVPMGKQFGRGQHRRHASSLIKDTFATFDDEGTQNQLVPMLRDRRIVPEFRSDRFLSHLFRRRDIIGLDLAIRVIRANHLPTVVLDALKAEIQPRRLRTGRLPR